ncbi:MAG: tetratricopeptide repeat protein [Bacteroidota bacterium]|nr:tetratricopeptide repeat protein [Bacteroidota bacterium]
MESIKNIRTLILAGLLFLAGNGFAQSSNNIIQAFSDSYTQEKEGKYSTAIETIKKVYAEDSYEINLRLGWLNYNAGLYTESASYYRKAVTLMPYSIEAKLGLVLPVYAQGNLTEVINVYRDILKIDKMNYTANYRLGAINYGRENYTKAYVYFEKLINMYPFDYDAINMFAWTNFRQGKLREAKVLFTKALMNNPNDESAKLGLEKIK